MASLHEIYREAVAAGFTEAQAMQIVIAIMLSGRS